MRGHARPNDCGPEANFVSGHRSPGRPSLTDAELFARRDALVWLLSVTWADIGWQLPQVTSLEELGRALEPLRGHASERDVVLFLRQTSVAAANTKEIRARRKTFEEALKRSSAAQMKNDNSAEASRIAELAMDQVRSEKEKGPMLMEISRRRREATEARMELDSALVGEKALREQLRDEEAGFSQNELLNFIAARKYARNPLRLADAMAGLPEMTWEQSYERCSKIKCGQWPTFPIRIFETIKNIWNRRNSHPDLVLPQLFRQEIEKLSKTVLASVLQPFPHPVKKRKINNPVRSHLAENWRYLRLAIEEVAGAEVPPDRVPFLILSHFNENMAKPRRPLDLILIANEKIST